MGAAYETISAISTAPGAVVTVMTASTGQSLAIRNTRTDADIRLLGMWAFQNAAGIFRVRSPRLHDNVQGIRQQVLATQATPMLPKNPLQKLYPQDALILENTGSAVAGQIETGFVSVYYQDLLGVAARFIDVPALNNRGVNLVGVEVDTTPGVGGGWTGTSALNKTFDNLKANTDYALVGWTLSAAAGGIGIQGPDTGNLIVGAPGQTPEVLLLQEYFIRLSRLSGIPLIPVINSANKAGTNIVVAQTQAGTAVNVSVIMVELAPMGAPSPTARPAGA